MTSLVRNTVLLTMSGMVEFTLQFLVPVIFVRYLDPTTFGEYRLLWLIASTALALAPAFMPQSLFYFLPRGNQDEQGVRVGNVLAYLTLAGVVVAFLTSAWSPFRTENIGHLFADSKGLSSIFLGCWMIISVMNVLPLAEGRIGWKVRNDVTLSLLRTALLASAAILTRQLVWVMVALMIDAGARLATMGLYLYTRVGGVKVRLAQMWEQLQYSLPFATGSALFQLRGVADQWIIASMLSPSMFGLFSISSIFLSIAVLIRQPISNAITPHLSQAFADGRFDEFVELFHKSSSAATLMLVVLSGGLLCVTRELVEIIYTGRYAAAVPTMRVYLLSMTLYGCAAGYVLPILNRARVAVFSNACCLALSVVCGYIGTILWGLPGTACGGVIALVAGEWWSLHIVARSVGVRVIDLLPMRSLFTSGTACAVALAVVAFVAHTIHGATLVHLLAKGSLFVAVFSAVFLALGGKSQLELLRKPSASAAPVPGEKIASSSGVAG